VRFPVPSQLRAVERALNQRDFCKHLSNPYIHTKFRLAPGRC
jgi:hypothetical protein